MGGTIRKADAISDQYSVEMTREINEKSSKIYSGGGGSEGGMEFKKCHYIASDEGGGKKSVKATKVST